LENAKQKEKGLSYVEKKQLGCKSQNLAGTRGELKEEGGECKTPLGYK